uniref:Uncharacterized protein n=1 Tax=Oryza glumipatula TaxID=40148 RepID=A0A0E0BI35_9ORYZ
MPLGAGFHLLLSRSSADADAVGRRLLRSSASYGALPLPIPSASTPTTSSLDPAAPMVEGARCRRAPQGGPGRG